MPWETCGPAMDMSSFPTVHRGKPMSWTMNSTIGSGSAPAGRTSSRASWTRAASTATEGARRSASATSSSGGGAILPSSGADWSAGGAPASRAGAGRAPTAISSTARSAVRVLMRSLLSAGPRARCVLQGTRRPQGCRARDTRGPDSDDAQGPEDGWGLAERRSAGGNRRREIGRRPRIVIRRESEERCDDDRGLDDRR